jgi:hypothetical protein
MENWINYLPETAKAADMQAFWLQRLFYKKLCSCTEIYAENF